MTFGLLQIVTGDRAISLDSIRSIGPRYKRRETWTGGTHAYDARVIYLRGPEDDRSTAIVTQREFEALMRQPLQLMPAQPGTTLLRPYFPETGDLQIFATDVIAWALCVDGVVRPVTPGGVNDGGDDEGNLQTGVFVELPGGKLEGVGADTEPSGYANIAEMRADLTERFKPKSAVSGAGE